jgi:hypothetical protein
VRQVGIEGLGRPQDHAELLAGHYLAALALDRSGNLVSSEVREGALRAFPMRASGRRR